MNIETPKMLQQAVQQHQAGQFQQAETLYRQVLQREPDNPEALHLLGVLAYQTRRGSAALGLITRAIGISPMVAGYHSNLGNVLRALGRREEAIAAYQKAIALQPDLAEAYNNLGLALQDDGQLNEAMIAILKALAFKPDYVEAHNNLGNVLMAKGDLQQAIECYQKALELKPEFAEAHNNLGNAYMGTGQVSEAMAGYRKAIELRPDYPEAHFNLGNALCGINQMEGGIAAYLKAIDAWPHYPEAHNNLGRALADQGRWEEAIACYRKAIALRPEFAAVQSNLGAALLHNGQVEEAVACFRNVIAGKPDDAINHSYLVLGLNTLNSDPQTIFEESTRWARQHAEPLRKYIRHHVNDRSPMRRLRVGYVSADFCDHPNSRVLMPLFQNHNRQQVEVVCYADVARADSITARLKKYAWIWRDVGRLPDDKLADIIHEDGIDILVDLSLHTPKNRLLVFAAKPSPVQVTWLGYPGTTGLSTIDYRLTDRYLDPVEEGPANRDAFYSEKSIHLPESYWCYDPLTEESAIPESSGPPRKTGRITFGCLNTICEFTERTLNVWARILGAVKNSRLLLCCDSAVQRSSVLRILGQGGIDPQRIEFIKSQPRHRTLAVYQLIDIVLDTVPGSGQITTLDALWMGVPVVTSPGLTAISRAGLSILSTIGLPQLVATDADSYVKIAAELAGDPPRLADLRANLRNKLQQSPLMDGNRFAKNVEAAYRQMWRQWCEKG